MSGNKVPNTKKSANAKSRNDKNIASAIFARNKARDQEFKKLLDMSSDDRAKVDLSVFRLLTGDQLRQLLEPGHEKIDVNDDLKSQSVPTDKPKQPPKQKPIRVRSPFAEACITGLTMAAVGGMAAIGAILFGPELTAKFAPPPIRPINSSLWPACPRLDAGTDGCIYHVQTSLGWKTAASDLQIQESQLHLVNPTLLNLSPGTLVVVWRGLGSLTQ